MNPNINPNTNRYTLIAYKPDSDDYCRGCHMASYSSDLIIFNALDVNKIIDKMVECNTNIELNDNCNEAGYKFSIYKNGIIISGNDAYGENMTDEEWEEWNYCGIYDAYLAESKSILETVDIKTKELVKIGKDKKMREIAKKNDELRLQKEKEEKELLDKLKKKYE